MIRDESSPDILEIMRDGKRIDEALKRAAREAILQHRRAGLPVVIWHDGRTVWVNPEDIDLESGEWTPRSA